MKPKNPYRALWEILTALPPEQQTLLDGVLRGRIYDGTPCGCAFGVAYPETATLDRAFDTEDPSVIYDLARQDPSESGLIGEARSVGAAFRDWVVGLGGDYRFLRNVVRVNDDPAFENRNDRATCEERYRRVVAFLADAADAFDQGKKIVA